MIRTGNIESWADNPWEMGPLYPLVGWEMPMFVVCIAFCIAFTVWKFVSEHAKYDQKARELRENSGLQNLLNTTKAGDDDDG